MAEPSNQDICNTIKAMDSKIASSFEALHATIAGLTSRLEEKDAEVKSLQKTQNELISDVLCLKTELNDIKLAEKGLNLRAFGLKVSPDEIAAVGESKAIMKKAYEIIKPILAAAKANGGISAVTPLANLLSSAHLAGKPTRDKQGRTLPAPCIIKFQSVDMRNLILRYKKAHLPNPTDAEKASGIRKFLLAEDLTKPSHDMFKKLIDDPRTCTVWTMSGALRYTLAGDEKKTVHRVESPFLPLSTILGS